MTTISNETPLRREVTVRAATTDDVAGILDIYNDAIARTTGSYKHAPVSLDAERGWFDGMTEGGWPVLVAEQGDAICGFASFAPFRASASYLYTVEHSIFVASHARRMGVGSALLPALIEAAHAKGMHAMIASIDVNNVATIHLHEKFGFAKVAHFKEIGYKFHRWLDLIFMQKLISNAPPDSKT